MRVLFTSLRVPSHFLPLVPFIAACRSGGHDVAIAAPEDLREQAARTGALFFPFPHPGDAGLGPIWARLRTAPEAEQKNIVIGEIFAGVSAAWALPELLHTIDAWKPSIVVRESQEYAAVVAAERAGIPHARVAITARSAEIDVLRCAAPSVDQHRAKLGLSSDPEGKRILDETALTLFPASLEAPGTDDSRILRFRAVRKTAPPLPDWWPGRQGPFAYVTLGTVMGKMDESRALYRVVLDALVGLPIRALLTIGSALPVEELGEVPPHVHVERFVPQDDVLPHASVLVCHGGSGTMLGGLSAGVPLVVAPMFADQPFNAERIAAAGAGVALPKRGATSENLRRAVERVLGEVGFRDAARRCAKEIAALRPVDEVGSALERIVRSRHPPDLEGALSSPS